MFDFRGLVDGQFLGIDFDAVCETLNALGFEGHEVIAPTEDTVGSITIGSSYGEYYYIEFDENGICEISLFGECED